jgi:UDP-2,3-diacylglucosamine hydrolase
VAASVSHFPVSLAQKIREHLQKRSQAGYSEKTARWDYRQILLDFADVLRKQGYDGLVSGHFHLAMCENIPDHLFTVLSLGDWMGQYTYGEMLDSQLLLKNYSPKLSTS